MQPKTAIATLAVAMGLAAQPATADEKTSNPQEKKPVLVAFADNDEVAVSDLPDGIRGFNGQVGGIVQKKEEGRVFFKIIKVQKVWPRANKAENPEALNGKTVIVRANSKREQLQVRFVNKMIVGEDYRLNIKHGEQSVFLITELDQRQRAIAGAGNDKPREEPPGAASAADEKVDKTKAPPGLYGFSGQIVGRLVNKDTEKGELTLEIRQVQRVWRNNKAKRPKSAEGRTLKIEGVFGKFLDVLLTLKEGDGVQIETKHVKGDNLRFLGEGLKKVELPEPRKRPSENTPANDDQVQSSGAPAGLAGFRGILIGTLVSKDVEAGTLVFKMDSVKRVWRKNQAKKPELSKGKNLSVKGVSGKFLDVLLVLKPGDKIEVEAFHNRGEHLDFPGELLKKVE